MLNNKRNDPKSSSFSLYIITPEFFFKKKTQLSGKNKCKFKRVEGKSKIKLKCCKIRTIDLSWQGLSINLSYKKSHLLVTVFSATFVQKHLQVLCW